MKSSLFEAIAARPPLWCTICAGCLWCATLKTYDGLIAPSRTKKRNMKEKVASLPTSFQNFIYTRKTQNMRKATLTKKYPIRCGGTHCMATRNRTRLQLCAQAAQSIATWWCKQKNKATSDSAIDPITLDVIKDPFIHVERTGQTNSFSATALASYIAATGDYRNPITRTALNAVEIKRLQTTAARHGLKTSIEAKERHLLQRKRQMEESSLDSWLENDFLNTVHRIREAITDLERTQRSVMQELTRELLPILHASFVPLASREDGGRRGLSLLFIATKMIDDAPVVHTTAQIVVRTCLNDLKAAIRGADTRARNVPPMGAVSRAQAPAGQRAGGADAEEFHAFLSNMLTTSRQRNNSMSRGEWPSQRQGTEGSGGPRRVAVSREWPNRQGMETNSAPRRVASTDDDNATRTTVETVYHRSPFV